MCNTFKKSKFSASLIVYLKFWAIVKCNGILTDLSILKYLIGNKMKLIGDSYKNKNQITPRIDKELATIKDQKDKTD